MFGLSHLFYPWGVVLQIMAIVHFVKRRPENYWLWIILIGGPIGASAYLLVEVAPDARLLGGVFQGFGRRSRIQTLETQILDNPSAGNYEELGELNLEEKKYGKAREALARSEWRAWRRPSRRPCITPPVCASASCRFGLRIC